MSDPTRPQGSQSPGGQWPPPQQPWQPQVGGQYPAGWAQQEAVWPPPVNAPATQTVFFPFKHLLMRVRGHIADFREGAVGIDSQGITINGKVQLRAEIFQPIWITCFILFRLLGLIVYCIMRYGMLKPMELRLPWQMVQEIVLSPAKRQACIVYDAPNYKNVMKTFSLAFKLPPAEYEQFMAMAHHYAPQRTTEGKIGSLDARSKRILIVLLVLVIAIIGLAVYFGK